jgi:hypothetical protein
LAEYTDITSVLPRVIPRLNATVSNAAIGASKAM